MSDRVTADTICALLDRRYSNDRGEWITLREVRDTTGFQRRVSLDFLALGAWPSKGCHLVGVEVKVSRGDWLRELDHPEKRAPWLGQLNELWVAAPVDVVKEAEVPKGWGLVAPTKAGDKLRTIRRPTPDDEAIPDKLLWASILRSAMEEPRKLRARMAELANLAGRPLSLADLERLVDLWHHRHWTRKEQRDRREKERREESMDRSRKLAEYINGERRLVKHVADALHVRCGSYRGWEAEDWAKLEQPLALALAVLKRLGIAVPRGALVDWPDVPDAAERVAGVQVLEEAQQLAGRLEKAAADLRRVAR